MSLKTARWYSSWILFSAVVPVLIMYGVWGSLTLTGKLKSALQTKASPNGGSANWIELQDLDALSMDSGPNSPTCPCSATAPLSNDTSTSTGSGSSGKETVKMRSNSVLLSGSNNSSMNTSNSNMAADQNEKEPDEYASLLGK